MPWLQRPFPLLLETASNRFLSKTITLTTSHLAQTQTRLQSRISRQSPTASPAPKVYSASSQTYEIQGSNAQRLAPSSINSSSSPITTGIPGRSLSAAMTGSSLTAKAAAFNALANSFTPINPQQGSVSKITTTETTIKKGKKRKSSKNGSKLLHTSQTDSSGQDAKLVKPRQPPSRSSGGIPSPSTAYLMQSLHMPTLLPNPRRILVILDLNGTLLFRPSRKRPSKFIERPHAKDFLKYCLDTFYLAIWSSARPDNVNNMVAQLLTPEQRKKCVVIWARDKFGLSKEDYDARVQVYKRLSIVWNSPIVKASHPDAGSGVVWDQSNTVLVDDSMEKGRSEPYNILPIPEFSGLAGESLHVLPQVHDYLNGLCFQEDISRHMRENPFGLDPDYTLPVGS